jgi:hypothetical protein
MRISTSSPEYKLSGRGRENGSTETKKDGLPKEPAS